MKFGCANEDRFSASRNVSEDMIQKLAAAAIRSIAAVLVKSLRIFPLKLFSAISISDLLTL